MLELAVLGLLKERSMHGYQLKKHLADTLGSFWVVSYGSLYPTLRPLQREGAVQMIFPKDEVGRTKDGDPRRRGREGAVAVDVSLRKEEAGGREVVDGLPQKRAGLLRALGVRAGHDGSEDNGFSVRFTFFKHRRPEARIRLLERRRASLD